ncbi:hypothetical protein CIK05_10375 [Bdellovibrio sp. qaytius]|nr:hypothetical protein CIK05_10375 [Bdellovibrio sp. qaytius]
MEFLVHGEITADTKRVIILLHGFPGISTKQNRDLAPILFEKLGIPTAIVFYPGLSVNPGKFKYTTAYKLVCDFLNQCLAKNKNIKFEIFGHSFGGYISLRLAKDFNSHIEKIFLLSPLLHVISDQLLEELVTKLYRENSQLERHSLEEFYEDHNLFVPGYHPDELKKYLANIKVKLLQSKDDTITPTAVAKEFVKDTTIKYEESWQEHAFTSDRQEVFDKVVEFFA